MTLAIAKFLNTATHFANVPKVYHITNVPVNFKNYCPLSGDVSNATSGTFNEMASGISSQVQIVRVVAIATNNTSNHSILAGVSDGTTDTTVTIPAGTNGTFDSGAINVIANTAIAGVLNSVGFTVGNCELTVTVYIQTVIS